ncbi:MAG TPA: hypothetical protein VGL39_08210 [Jatrophihabitantaceae bacterium]
MRTRSRALLGLLTGLALLGALAGPASAVPARAPAPASAPAPAPQGIGIGGIRFGYLPAGLGQASDFYYEYDEVAFTARVWESPAPSGGWRVDADIEVLSGDRLTDGAALHDWFVAYQERPPADAHYVPMLVHGRPGWLARDQLFWLVRPGLAVSVRLDGTRWSTSEVVRIGWAADADYLPQRVLTRRLSQATSRGVRLKVSTLIGEG